MANGMFDKCYVPRNAQYTGAIDIHELGIRKGGTVVFVNTKYNCLCVPSVTHSFKVIWKPSFISKIVPEDRCHLNGLAMKDGKPKYVTAVCRSDTIDGWRDRRHDGGVVIDVETNEIVCEGLSMPHSPRWADGKLWVLNSGTGYLGTVDFATRRFVPHVFCPGFLRGLAIKGDFAAIGLSKPRNARFDGLELQKNLRGQGQPGVVRRADRRPAVRLGGRVGPARRAGDRAVRRHLHRRRDLPDGAGAAEPGEPVAGLDRGRAGRERDGPEPPDVLKRRAEEPLFAFSCTDIDD